MPDLKGLTKGKAIKKLGEWKEQFGFTYSLGEVTNKYSTKVKKGRIISQSPKAGETVRTNEPIRLVISKGPEMVQIPQLVYLTKEQAVRKLEKAGLRAEIATAYSEQAAEGLVIAQSVEDGKKAAKGSSVKLTVSLGKEPVQSTGGAGGTGSGGSTGSGSTGNSGTGGNTGGTGNSGGSQAPAGNAGSGGSMGSGSAGNGGTGGNTGGTGNSGTGQAPAGGTGSGGAGQPTGGSGGSTGENGGGQTPSGGSSGDGGSGGNRAIMPDGGSFIVE